MTTTTKHTRTLGSLLGGAIGDALGAPIEFTHTPTPPATLHYQRNPHDIPAPLGAVTDDTQLTIHTLTALITSQHHGTAPHDTLTHHYRTWRQHQNTGASNPHNSSTELHTNYLTWLHHVRAPGGACLAVGPDSNAAHTRDTHPSPDAKGCGTVMRSAPFGLAYEHPASAYLIAARAANITHGHPTAHHAAGALAWLVCALVHGTQTLQQALTDVLDHTSRLWATRHAAGALEVNHALAAALAAADRLTTVDGMEAWSETRLDDQGWTAAPALAMAVAAALAADGDADRLYRLACWHSGDSDSVGAIAGNLYGAAVGADALPADLVAGNEATELLTLLTQHLNHDLDVSALYPR